jgi:predicted enzyme related to lactoylglutathione lyase
MPASIGFIAIDSVDPDQITPFWCALLGVEVESNVGDGQFVLLAATPNGLTVGFQRVPEPKTTKNRVYLDLVVDDLDAVTAEVHALGGTWLQPKIAHDLEGFQWRCMADPQGNEFDIDVLPAQ